MTDDHVHTNPFRNPATWVTAFVAINAAGRCFGADSEPVVAVFENKALPVVFYVAAAIWEVVAVYCLFKSAAGKDILRFVAGLACVTGLGFGIYCSTFSEKVEVTPTAIKFHHCERYEDIYVPFGSIREVRITQFARHRRERYINCRHEWHFDVREGRHERPLKFRLWFIDTKRKEAKLVEILRQHGVRTNETQLGVPFPILRDD